MFLSFDCPVSNSYAAPLAELAREYGRKGVTFVGVCPTDAPSAEVAKQSPDNPVERARLRRQARDREAKERELAKPSRPRPPLPAPKPRLGEA